MAKFYPTVENIAFPSPVGDYVSSQLFTGKPSLILEIGFPSPVGDYVSSLRLRQTLLRQTIRRKFPSPVGDYVSSPEIERTGVAGSEVVSVPCRGLCFFTK